MGVTGYERKFYADIEMMRACAERTAAAVERIAAALETRRRPVAIAVPCGQCGRLVMPDEPEYDSVIDGAQCLRCFEQDNPEDDGFEAFQASEGGPVTTNIGGDEEVRGR